VISKDQPELLFVPYLGDDQDDNDEQNQTLFHYFDVESAQQSIDDGPKWLQYQLNRVSILCISYYYVNVMYDCVDYLLWLLFSI
jgi:hypothetical protein